MSKARELALLEKWTDAAATTLPPISPTSPKATKFCCCPNRRRYNLKQPKKSTLHARNIFLDNEFTYIDDVVGVDSNNSNSNSTNNNNNSNSNSYSTGNYSYASDIANDKGNNSNSNSVATKWSATCHNHTTDYDDIIDCIDAADVVDGYAAGNCNANLMNAQQQQQQQQQTTNKHLHSTLEQCWRPDKSCHNNNSDNDRNCNGNNNNSNNSNLNIACDGSCAIALLDTPTESVALLQQQQQQQQLQQQRQGKSSATRATATAATIDNDCAVTANNTSKSDNDSVAVIKQQQQQHSHECNQWRNNKSNSNSDSNKREQQIQRLSNSEFNRSNNNNNNNHNNNLKKREQQQQQREQNNICNNSDNNKRQNESTEQQQQQQRNCQFDSSVTTTTTTTTTTPTPTINSNSRNNNSATQTTLEPSNAAIKSVAQLPQQRNDCDKIDLPHKMTITTTNAASRKRSECGLTSATNTATTSAMTIANDETTAADMAGTATTTTTLTSTTATAATSSVAATTAAPMLVKTTTPSASPTPTPMPKPTPMARPTTPSLTTVIKTTMVKRTPSRESSSTPPTTPTSPTRTTMRATVTATAYNAANGSDVVVGFGVGNGDATSQEPSRTVKQRIAAFAAGKEQMRNHDNSIKAQQMQNNNNNCGNSNNNKHQSNMTTSAKSAINSLNYKQPLISNKCETAAAATVPSTTATAARATATISSAAAMLTLPTANTINITTTTATTPTTAGSTGYATMPRRSNSGKCGSATSMTDDNKRLNIDMNGVAATETATATATATATTTTTATATTTPTSATSAESCRKLAATLDNLDLALVRDLTDDDGEDSYSAFQEYLERVEHEINEVFEMRRARQRAQQQQAQQMEKSLQQQQAQQIALTADDITPTDDELSLCTDANRLPQCATTTTAPSTTCNMTQITCHNATPSDGNDLVNNAIANINATSPSTSAPKIPTTTVLKALPPPPLSPSGSSEDNEVDRNNHTLATTSSAASTLKRQRRQQYLQQQQQQQQYDADSGEDVNIWANKFLRDLDNLMSSTRPLSLSACSSPTSKTSPQLLSAAATAAIQSRYGRGATEQREAAALNGLVVLRPEKHTTIPLQSFNLDCGRRDNGHGNSISNSNNTECNTSNMNNNNSSNINGGGGGGGGIPAKSSVVYMRTLSAPTPYHQQLQQQQQQLQYSHDSSHKSSLCGGNNSGNSKDNRNSLATFSATTDQHHQHYHNLTNLLYNGGDASALLGATSTPSATTILKIEETATAAAAAAAAAATSGRRQPQMAVTLSAALAAQDNATDEESLKSRRQRQLENDMETTTTTTTTTRTSTSHRESHVPPPSCNNKYSNGSDKNMLVAANGGSGLPTTVAIPKRERINHAMTMTTKPATTATSGNNNTVLLPSTLLTSSKTNGGGNTNSHSHSHSNGSLLLNGSDATKKGSTSTIWTSEESILRSVGAVDEDNNSTSSSACEEASGVLSSGKSGISLDSSGLDNDNNESGIGTATPPKDISYWKNAHNDNESVSSLDALRKMKFQKSSSVASSDDPDLLEVLSLCDEPQGDEDVGVDVDESHDDIEHERQQRLPPAQHKDRQKVSAPHQQQTKPHQSKLQRGVRVQQRSYQPQSHRQQLQRRQDDNSDNVADDSNDALELADDDCAVELDEEDEGHDEFATVPYCDCECSNDGDLSIGATNGSSSSTVYDSSANNSSGGSGSGGSSGGVVLRRRLNATPIMVPQPKCRSHSLDTASLPNAYYSQHHQHPFQHHHSNLHSHHQLRPLARQLHHHHHHHHHLHGRNAKERGQLSLALRQEPFQSLLSPTHFHELPSPSSASLHSGHESLDIQELTTKSNSAPLLLKQEKTRRDDFAGQKLTLRYSRSQSDRYLAEIEAVEACKWLRAAGFPQYAQMYEDHQFPIDLTNVAKDHTNLENDQLQSLYRRLCILNRCANMRLDQSHKAQTPQKEDSDDENCALSENWTFQPHIRRWSRIGEMGLELPPAGKLNIEKTESSSKESSPDRFEDDSYDISGAALSLTLPGNTTDSTLHDAADSSAVRLRRTGSERFKDGAKALLRRVESIKSRRRKRQNREGIVISGPQALDLSQLGQRSSMRKPDAVYSTPPSPSAVSPMHTFPKGPIFGNELKVPSHSENFLSPNRASPKRTPTTPRSMRTSPLHFFSNPMPHLREGKSDDSSSYYSDSQESSTGGKLSLRKTPSKTRRFLQRTGKVDDIGAHSDSECHHGRKLLIKDANSNTTEVKIKKLTRGGSLNLGKDPKKRDGFRSSSFRSRSTTRKESKPDDGDNVKRTPVVRWHSFQMEERPHMIFRKCFSQKIDPHSNDHGISFAAMSAGQLQILRKLALVILTGYMERYCPTHRSGWNWELPKFIKKIKMPDYKDKKVFGVPLLLVLQRTGQTLPVAIRAAFRWLQLRALDQIGLFRKSGVKSRIIKLKAEIENLDSNMQCMEVYDTQQAYDVADMLKQYFRDLPESLLTTKMSETFAAIFQHLPKDVRLEAVQCAVLLLPDENREILYALLEFLTLVAANADHNQMTANNLAVCLAPSLFHSSISTGATSLSASPRRRKGAGVPDDKELQEAKASHECLAFMIEHYKQIYTATKEKISKCNFGYMEESKPVPLEALGEGMQFHNWRGYLYECTSATIKEGREKTRGWFTITSLTDTNVDIAYKKVGDGHPLRLWRCTTEVEGPPKEVLDYIIKQRATWDQNLLESQTVKKLDERTEIFQYALDGQFTTDFCVLRSWQTDLPRGACVIVETSIDHSKAKPMFGAVRGVVLASRYLIEPCGSGRSRVMHLSRVDIKGRTPEWYNKSYGHICSHYLSKIRFAFKHIADGPESKV